MRLGPERPAWRSRGEVGEAVRAAARAGHGVVAVGVVPLVGQVLAAVAAVAARVLR